MTPRRPERARAARRPSRADRRAFVHRHTRLREVEGTNGIRLHLADEVEQVWHAVEEILGAAADGGAPIPFWAFAWAGGLAMTRYLIDHPDAVTGRRVMDFATGSGLVAIAAARAGAERVTAVDVDPFAELAVEANARANGAAISWLGRDLLDGPPPEVDVLLAADTWYEGPLADRVLPWLRRAAAAGISVVTADPGRRYLPDTSAGTGFRELGRYEVRTTTTLEDRERVESTVWALQP